MLLYSVDTKIPTDGTFIDEDAYDGWNYYTVYLYDADNAVWAKAAQTSALGITDYEFTRRMHEILPAYFRTIHDRSAGFDPVAFKANPAIYLSSDRAVPNLQLSKYLSVIGWGMDTLRSQIEEILHGYDPNKAHLSRLVLLAEQFGFRIEQSAPTPTTRNLVRNLGSLYRQRGTLNGLKEILSLATGWDVDVVLGPNIMLNRDQSNFESPQVDEYDKGVLYQVGELVQKGGVYYKATAITFNSAPPGANWQQVIAVEEDEMGPVVSHSPSIIRYNTKRSLTQGHSTWQAIALSPRAPQPANVSDLSALFIGRGVNRFDTNDVHTNGLGFRNLMGATKDFWVQSIPYDYDYGLTARERKLILESAVPVPAAVQVYNETTRYARGSLVRYRGVVYEAIHANATTPTNTVAWKKLGYDERVRLSLSMYAHGPFSGTDGTGGRLINPWVAGFDDQGNTLWERELTSALFTNVKYDTFNTTGVLAASKAMDFGGTTWTTIGGTWNQGYDEYIYGGYQYSGSGQTYAVSDVGYADGVVAVTMLGVGTRKMGLMLRQTNATNYIRVDQTNIISVIAGAETVLAVHSTPFTGGERMTVTLLGTAITVLRNGVQVSTTTSTLNQTTTRHGVVIEA